MNCKFDKIAEYYNPLIKIFANPKKHYKKIRDVFELNKNLLVLDLGGGTGLIADYISKDVKKVIILDPSERMLKKVKNNKIQKARGIAQKIPFKNKTFDFVYCVDSFHHFTNGYKKQEYSQAINICIEEILRVLKRDGVLLIIEFDNTKFFGKLLEIFENYIIYFGSKFYSKNELKLLFEEYDVKVETFDINNFSYLARITKK